MTRKAIYPGTFDPPHRGHIDLIERGQSLVDELIVAVAVNPDKTSVFNQSERVDLIRRCVADLPSVRVLAFEGLVVDLARRESTDFILRGIRTFSDFEAECSMALMNRQLAGSQGETVFVMPSQHLAHYSSRWVKEVASFGGDVESMLPEIIAKDVMSRLASRGR